ncbi:CLUMA_CG003704, isoform B [Clunio marinus]|nr:CLUMA_CG003704, isoform B [Clunio marinus]
MRETEEIRNFSLKAMREWIMQNPRILKTRLDAIWLLKQLRFKKYNMLSTQETLERHVVLKCSYYGKHYLHDDLDVMRPSVKKIFDVNPVCILPKRDQHGRPILFFRCQNVKPQGKDLSKDILTAVACIVESLVEIEEFLIRGVVYVLDVSGITMQYLKILPIEDCLKVCKSAEKITAGRHKGFHVVNVPSYLTTLINMAIKHTAPKFRDRVRFYSSFDELDIIDKGDLPKEYGGTIPMSEMSKELWEILLKYRPLLIKYQDMKINENLYPKACLDGSFSMLDVPLNSPDLFEKASRCCDETVFGIQGSFRKLEID